MNNIVVESWPSLLQDVFQEKLILLFPYPTVNYVHQMNYYVICTISKSSPRNLQYLFMYTKEEFNEKRKEKPKTKEGKEREPVKQN